MPNYRIVALGIKLIPISHISKVPGTESLRLRKCSLEVETYLFDDARTPFLFGFAADKVSSQLPVKEQLLRVDLHRSLDLCAAIAGLYISHPTHIVVIEVHVVGTDHPRLIICFFVHTWFCFDAKVIK